MSSVLVHFRVFFTIIKISFIKNLMYRTNLLILFLDSLIWFVLSIIFFKVIYQHADTINGWNIHEIYLLIGVSDLIKSCLFAFFIKGLTNLPNLIRTGDLDGLLTKPVNSQFLISLSDFNLSAALNLLPSIFLICYSFVKLDLSVMSLNFLLFLLMVIVAIIFCYSLWYMIMTASVWLKNSGDLNEFFLSLTTMMRYPAGIYKGVTGILLLIVVPVVIAGNLPVSILIHHLNLKSVILFTLTTLVYLLLSQMFWRFSLKFYDSSSS
ncbi:ABC transporter permease [Bacillus cereus]|uniref:ABC transporter permease n=1 Tax=Bacillus cereus TaxID=1396 RepID=UPI0039804DE4